MNHFFLERVSDIAHKFRADEFIGQRYKGTGAIFMGHSVVESRRGVIDENLQVSADFLNLSLNYYVENGIDIISLDSAIERMETGNKKQFVCFTFDDGYRDNLTVALPIFRKYNKPFTVYVTTAFLERRIDNWWIALRDAILHHEEDFLDIGGRRFATLTRKQKAKTFRSLCCSVDNAEIELDEVIYFARQKGMYVEDILDNEALTAAELQVLAKDPLVEIGGHTKSHRRLAQLSLEEARDDILQNKFGLETLLKQEVRHFAYPYGDSASCGEREFAVCKELGFRTATTTRIGGLFPDHLLHYTSLPRIRFSGRCESIPFIECQRNGALTAIKTRFGPPVVGV
jgi:peptidoglycan/xylan/chitin deacetylase (PgdA/CDA1 family)